MIRLTHVVVAVTLVHLLTGCGSGAQSSRSGGTPPETASPIPLVATPADVLTVCAQASSSAICPTRLPRTTEAYRARVIDLSHGPGPEPGYQVLEISSSGPSKRFVHIVIKLGNLRDAYSFPFPPMSSGVTVSSGAPPSQRNRPILLGTPEWEGKAGTLVLAPSFPAGGIDGDHAIFEWSEDGTDHALSMHVTGQVAETVAMLRVLVGSIERQTD